jgi:hypothetical protein
MGRTALIAATLAEGCLMSIEITPFEAVSVDQREASGRAALAISGALAAMTFTVLVVILA